MSFQRQVTLQNGRWSRMSRDEARPANAPIRVLLELMPKLACNCPWSPLIHRVSVASHWPTNITLPRQNTYLSSIPERTWFPMSGTSPNSSSSAEWIAIEPPRHAQNSLVTRQPPTGQHQVRYVHSCLTFNTR